MRHRTSDDIRNRCRPVWIAAALMVLGLGGHAEASVLCGRQSGGHIVDGATIKLRESCKSNELAVNPLELGLSSQPHLVVRTGNTISTNFSLSTAASCEDGEVATGGGGLATGANGGLPVMSASRPQPDDAGGTPTGWRVTIVNTAASGTITGVAYVVCAAP